MPLPALIVRFLSPGYLPHRLLSPTRLDRYHWMNSQHAISMVPQNSIHAMRSRPHSQFKLQAMQPIPDCDSIDQREVVNVPAESEFRSKCYLSDPAVLDKSRIKAGSPRNKKLK